MNLSTQACSSQASSVRAVSVKGMLTTLGLATLALLPSAYDPLAITDAQAQNATVTARGVAGDMDKRRRDPVLTVSRVVGQENVTLLVDTSILEDDLINYPVKYEFFVNRQFFTSQIRSTELPGPIGVTIGRDIATPPFNYSIVATILHPNRRFTTVVQGAAFNSDLSSTVSCDATVIVDEEEQTFSNDEVSTTQTGNDQFAFSFTGDGEDGEGAVGATLTVNGLADGENASGEARFVQDGVESLFNVTGTVLQEDGQITSISVDNEDGSFAIECD